LPKSIWSRVNKNGPVPSNRPELGPCWIWKGAKNAKGYGILQGTRAHRKIYEIIKAVKISPGKDDHHLCENKSCVNPEHQEILNRLSHVIASTFHNRNKTHCSKGHEYTEKNSYIDCYGYRQCRSCKRERYRKAHPIFLPGGHAFNEI